MLRIFASERIYSGYAIIKLKWPKIKLSGAPYAQAKPGYILEYFHANLLKPK